MSDADDKAIKRAMRLLGLRSRAKGTQGPAARARHARRSPEERREEMVRLSALAAAKRRERASHGGPAAAAPESPRPYCDCEGPHDDASCGWCDCGSAKPCPEHPQAPQPATLAQDGAATLYERFASGLISAAEYAAALAAQDAPDDQAPTTPAHARKD